MPARSPATCPRMCWTRTGSPPRRHRHAPCIRGSVSWTEGQIQNPNPHETAGDFPVVSHFTLKLPVSAGPAVVDDVVVMTSCPDHPRDVGVRLRVSSINPGTQKKTQNCQVEVISG
jgi:hypothetical protein